MALAYHHGANARKRERCRNHKTDRAGIRVAGSFSTSPDFVSALSEPALALPWPLALLSPWPLLPLSFESVLSLPPSGFSPVLGQRSGS